jgi:hypothetical protein
MSSGNDFEPYLGQPSKAASRGATFSNAKALPRDPVSSTRAALDRTAASLPTTIELMLFEHSADRAPMFVDAGIRTFLVDWESLGKDERQNGFDTEIRLGTIDELRSMTSVAGADVWCRINRFGAHTRGEVDVAIGAGADGLFLPMVTRREEVEQFLDMVGGRAATGILVETADALAHARELALCPLDRVYFGLNDFAISRGGGSIFRAVSDGSVQRAREAFANACFGFGGLTAVDAGHPVPCRRLIEEMARLGCQFTFLRRSFRRDLTTRAAHHVVSDILGAWHRCVQRDDEAVDRDHEELKRIIRELA